MAMIFYLGDNMRFFVLVLCLISSGPIGAYAADWYSVEGAQASINASSLPGPVYDPTISVAEFNRRITQRDPRQSLLVEITIPRSELSLKKIVDRQVRFESQNEHFAGRISAVFLPRATSDGSEPAQSAQIVVHAMIQNRQVDGKWKLADGATGTLSIHR